VATEEAGSSEGNRWGAVEQAAREAWLGNDHRAAADIVLRAYGNEIYAFVLAQFHGKAGPADDCFSDFSEDFWRGLAGFQWRCSIRAWCYKVARSACSRYRRSPHNRADRRAPGSAGGLLEQIAQQARSTTQVHLKTEVKDKIRELRDQLSEADRDLLILRVDRDMSWRDVVFALHAHQEANEEANDEANEEAPDEHDLPRLETNLRQRFAEVKRHLKRLAQEAGLL
jgi:RNA polymerase sigma factor (sigma-70 family)